MKDIGLWIGLALVCALAVSALLSGGDGQAPRVAPDFTLQSLDGIDVSLAEYRGSVVILDFWATWCKPCTTTFPQIHALEREFADRGVVLLVVSLDKSAQRARDHLVANGFPTENVLWGSLEAARDVKALYGVIGIPHTLIIDRTGIIRFSGYPTKVDADRITPWL